MAKYQFTVEIEFSDEVIENAREYAAGAESLFRRYLEDKVQDGLEGGYFDSVDAKAIQL